MAGSGRAAEGKTILVTGATSGIGLEAVRALAREGALVLVGARDPARGRAVVEELVRAGGRAEPFIADLSVLEAVRAAVERLAREHPRLDVLVNNAGIAPRRREVTPEGHERTWATNVLAPLLLTRLLSGLLLAAPEPRVVMVGSEAHRGGRIAWDDPELARGYGTWRAYTQSKLALLLLSRELARREADLRVNVVHPGAIATAIWRDTPWLVRALLDRMLPSSEKGAAPVVRLAIDPKIGAITGRYFSRFKEVEPSPDGRDDAAAARLWALVEAQLG